MTRADLALLLLFALGAGMLVGYASERAREQLRRCEQELGCSREGGEPVWSEGACGCVWAGPRKPEAHPTVPETPDGCAWKLCPIDAGPGWAGAADAQCMTLWCPDGGMPW